jgi:hypothetical protein
VEGEALALHDRRIGPIARISGLEKEEVR